MVGSQQPGLLERRSNSSSDWVGKECCQGNWLSPRATLGIMYAEYPHKMGQNHISIRLTHAQESVHRWDHIEQFPLLETLVMSGVAGAGRVFRIAGISVSSGVGEVVRIRAPSFKPEKKDKPPTYRSCQMSKIWSVGTVLNMLAITESGVHGNNSIWTFRVSGFKTPDPNLLLVNLSLGLLIQVLS